MVVPNYYLRVKRGKCKKDDITWHPIFGVHPALSLIGSRIKQCESAHFKIYRKPQNIKAAGFTSDNTGSLQLLADKFVSEVGAQGTYVQFINQFVQYAQQQAGA